MLIGYFILRANNHTKSLEHINPYDKEFTSMTKDKPMQALQFLKNAFEVENSLFNKIANKATQFKKSIIIPLKNEFTDITSSYEGLLDSCKICEKNLQMSCSNAETAYSLYKLSFGTQETAFNKGHMKIDDSWYREYFLYQAVISYIGYWEQ